MHAALRTLESIAARLAVTLILSATALLAGVARRLRRPADTVSADAGSLARHRLMFVGTFYNDAWFDAHVAPLLECDAIEHVTVVSDRALRATAGVTYAIPPRWLTCIVGRTLARSWYVIKAARRDRCDLLIGYHIMPNALICLTASRLLGRRCAYQMTGGPVQLIDGGIGSENTLLRRQRKPGRLRERLMHHLVRQFDLVVVRGRQGLDYLCSLGLRSRTTIIPAGIDVTRFAPDENEPAEFELITVGRLAPVKRYDRLLRIVAELARLRPDVGCAIIGDGPLRDELESLAGKLGITRNVKFLGQRNDVASLLRRGRLFVLTSESEGQSIAMMEAMAAGLPAVAPAVGELTDLLLDETTGLVINADDPGNSAARIDAMLSDDATLWRMSAACRKAIIEFAANDAVARRWSAALQQLTTGNVPKSAAMNAGTDAPDANAAFAATGAGHDR